MLIFLLKKKMLETFAMCVCRDSVCASFPFGFEGGMCDLNVFFPSLPIFLLYCHPKQAKGE